jgi:AraC-like DNA-binding protein
MNRIGVVLETPAVKLAEFDHPPGPHRDPETEIAPDHTISFVENGAFDVGIEGRRWKLGPGSIFVTAQGLEFSCRHECESPTDRCLSISYAARAVEDLRLADVPPPNPPIAALSPQRTWLRARLQSCSAGDEVRFELIAGALFESLAAEKLNGSRRRLDGLSSLMWRIDRAVDLIEVEYGRTLTLVDLAAAAGLSTFHFARAFRAITGLPPHRYLTAVRLRHAARLLQEGAGVTFSCYEAGFGSLAHFITAFRKRYGIVPSEVRSGAGAATLRAALSTPVWARRS